MAEEDLVLCFSLPSSKSRFSPEGGGGEGVGGGGGYHMKRSGMLFGNFCFDP